MSQHGVPERLSKMSKAFQEEGAGGSTMELLVETLTGTAFEMTVSPSDTIFAIKSKIFRVEGIPVSQQHLLHNLVELEDGCSLRALQLTGGARLRLVLGMRGGPISTRRLPPPPSLHDLPREDGEWGGCKVVLVFRDGDKLNMLHVRDDARAYSSSLPQLAAAAVERPAGAGAGAGASGAGAGGGSARDNAVTAGKMMDLRRRMRPHNTHGDKAEIQKTRSEEILSVPSLLDEPTEQYKGVGCVVEPQLSLYPCSGRLAPDIIRGRESPLLDAVDTDRDLAPLTHDMGSVGVCRGRASLSVLSASTSHLDHLTATRILPALSRHRNREHLHLSDDRLDRPPAPPAAPPAPAPAPAPRPAPAPADTPVAANTTEKVRCRPSASAACCAAAACRSPPRTAAAAAPAPAPRTATASCTAATTTTRRRLRPRSSHRRRWWRPNSPESSAYYRLLPRLPPLTHVDTL